MTNDELRERAEEAINEYFSDMSVSKPQAIENMRDLISDIQIKIQSLKD